MLPPLEPTDEQPPRSRPGQSASPPVAQPPRSGLTRWLDRHAHPESRTFRYLDLARALIQVLAVAGLLALVVQLREANITAKRDGHNRSVDFSRYVDGVVADEVASRGSGSAASGTPAPPRTLADYAAVPPATTSYC